MSKRTVRIGVFDRLPVIHGGVRHLLAPFPDLAVVTSAYDVPGLLYAARHDRLDVVLVESVDLDRPLGELLRELRMVAPDLRFVLFTSAVEVALVREALAIGGDGYVLKHSSSLTLATAAPREAAGPLVKLQGRRHISNADTRVAVAH
jgi:DNA-binding NarL/FixJ family response regulator